MINLNMYLTILAAMATWYVISFLLSLGLTYYQSRIYSKSREDLNQALQELYDSLNLNEEDLTGTETKAKLH